MNGLQRNGRPVIGLDAGFGQATGNACFDQCMVAQTFQQSEPDAAQTCAGNCGFLNNSYYVQCVTDNIDAGDSDPYAHCVQCCAPNANAPNPQGTSPGITPTGGQSQSGGGAPSSPGSPTGGQAGGSATGGPAWGVPIIYGGGVPVTFGGGGQPITGGQCTGGQVLVNGTCQCPAGQSMQPNGVCAPSSTGAQASSSSSTGTVIAVAAGALALGAGGIYLATRKRRRRR